jgi:patatin-related protein
VTADRTTTSDLTEAGVQELRLALVCYGGVSVAIYIHGVTQEIHKLVRASTVLERFPDQADHLLSGTEMVYFDLLARIAQGEGGRVAGGTRTRVVVDVISATSTAGINGVFLAKALAHNRTLDPLKKLWFEKGDISELLRGWKWVPTSARLASIAGSRGPGPPLRGDDMCRWLYQALEEMDAKPGLAGVTSLMPDVHELELFVSMTEYTGDQRNVPLYDPRFLRDRSDRHVMRFTCPGRPDQLSQLAQDSNHMLAFAARATSSFPGAFPPISLASYERAVGTSGLGAKASAYFPYPGPDGSAAADTYFIDGGVLGDGPLRLVLDVLPGRPAAREVDRRLAYVQPGPRSEEVIDREDTPPLAVVVLRGFLGNPHWEPILDEVIQRNETALRIRHVIEDRFPWIRERVSSLVKNLGAENVLISGASGERLVELRHRIEDLAVAEAGFRAATYIRQRTRSMMDSYAGVINHLLRLHKASSEATFVIAALRQWAADDGLLALGELDDDAAWERRRLLSTLDLDYYRRRIHSLIATASWLYGHLWRPGFPVRAELDEAKQRLYSHLHALDAVVADLMADASMKARFHDLFIPAARRAASAEKKYAITEFVDEHRDDLRAARDRVCAHISQHLPRLEAHLFEDVRWLVAHCGRELRGEVVTRYLGFPFWDVVVFPLQALTGVGERDHVEVHRISPADVKLFPPGNLSGMRLGRVVGLFSAPDRQRDYLLGRLHAAERLIKLLLELRPEPSMIGFADPAAENSWATTELVRECIPAFEAILVEEASDLDKAEDLIGEVQHSIAALRREASGVPGPAQP